VFGLRKFLPLFVIFVLLLTAQAGNVTVYFFYSTTCSHCHEESIFLTNLESRYPSVEIKRFAVDVSPSNAELLEKFMKAHDVPPLSGVPQTYIGDDVVLGYTNYETTGKLIEAKINTCLELGCNQTNISIAENYVINYPLLGRIDLKTLSLPALSVLIGLLDGFNPCAMWVLIYLIMMLSSTRDRKKMILVIGTFVLASGVWYFLIMSAWLNIFLFIGMANITRFIIGLIAVGAGLMNLKDFITLPKAVCKVTDAASQSDIMKKIDRFAKTGVVPATLLGIIILAFTVNTIEFACSFTFPALFTSILASNKLPALEYYFYILVYIFFYMLDDMIIFSVAVITLSSSDFSLKYGKFSQLVGGVTLLLLGLLLLFMPQVLSAI
jgi:thiol-disulfide isomerase/thioredoxin